MNLILFTEEELRTGVSTDDERARHIVGVLRRAPGVPFDIGIIDGRRGKARVDSVEGRRMSFSYELSDEGPQLYPIELIVGLSRPQTMRRVLRDCTSLGVSRLFFFSSERGEEGYAASSLWSSAEYRRHLIDGAQTAFSTRLPEVRLFPSLSACLDASAAASPPQALRAALDNYESSVSLGTYLRSVGSAVPAVALAVGSERGWSAAERDCLRSRNATLVHLGDRVLRTEVACIAAVGSALSLLGYHEPVISPRRNRQTSY